MSASSQSVKSASRFALGSRSIALFYLLSLTNNMWFLAGNWIFFWLRYMTYGQLGWIDALCFAFGMFMEIPTGAISDLLGKKRTIMLSQFFAAAGFLLVSSANDRYQILFGFLSIQAGWAFYSGAAEALAFDTLKAAGKEQFFDRVMARSYSLATVSSVAATLLGALLYEWHFRAPHAAMAAAYGLGMIMSFFLQEPSVDSEVFSLRSYWQQLSQGFKQLAAPVFKTLAPLLFTLLCVEYLFSFGFLKPAVSEHFQFFAREQAILFGLLGAAMALLLQLLPRVRERISDRAGLVILASALGAALIMVGILHGWVAGVLAICLITFAGEFSLPWISVIINREIPSQYRATTLSTVAMITKLPYILTAVIAGGLIHRGLIAQLCLVVGTATFLIVISSIWQNRKSG